VGRGVGHLMKTVVKGEVKDIETLNRLRPWMEDEAREKYGYKGKSRLVTEYHEKSETFSFAIIFDDESRD
jgi:hypothetical protein